MTWLGEKYGFETYNDWYKLTYIHFEESPKGESFFELL